MLYDILLILIPLVASYLSFRVGYKCGKGIEPKIEKPSIKRNKADKRAKTLLDNIENYDGTANGQKKL